MNNTFLRTVFLVLFFATLSVNECISQSVWKWVNPYPFGTDMVYIKFFNENTGYTVIEENVYKTTNSGTNWLIPGDSTKYFLDADFIDINNGFVSGAFIKKTTNGGFNWIDITYYVPVTVTFQTISFLNNYTGYVGCWAQNPISGVKGFIIRTTNGGTNWSQQSVVQPTMFIDLEMHESGFGRALATDSGKYKIYATSNFGNNWSIIETNIYGNSTKTKLTIVDDQKYFLISGQAVYSTTNSGYNWNVISNLTNINNMEFPLISTGYAVGKEGKLYNTTNGGINWNTQGSPLSLEYYGISFINQNTGFISGKKGAFLKTSNAGINWHTDTRSFTYQNINDIKFLNRDTLIAIGDSGIIYKSTNQGLNWQSIYTGTPLRFTKMQFLNVNSGYAMVRDSGYLLKTTNCGMNWIKQTIFRQMYSLSFYFINENTGYFSGSEGGWVNHFYKTTDGGTEWNEVSIGGRFITSIKFINSLTGFIGTSGDGIYKTTNSGNNWIEKQYNPTSSLNVYDFGFFDNNTLIACDDAYIYKSTNGGENWSMQVQLVTSGLIRIRIIDSSKAYVCGGSSLFFTSNQGNGWIRERFSYNSAAAFGVDFWDKKGFTVGFQGNMLTTVNNDTVGIKNNTAVNTESFILHQNYPNPFNPTTKIAFDLLKDSKVKLVVYDILGREVKTIINNEFRTAGKYISEFNSSQLASGVYFVRILVNDGKEFAGVKKMVLVK